MNLLQLIQNRILYLRLCSQQRNENNSYPTYAAESICWDQGNFPTKQYIAASWEAVLSNQTFSVTCVRRLRSLRSRYTSPTPYILISLGTLWSWTPRERLRRGKDPQRNISKHVLHCRWWITGHKLCLGAIYDTHVEASLFICTHHERLQLRVLLYVFLACAVSKSIREADTALVAVIQSLYITVH